MSLKTLLIASAIVGTLIVLGIVFSPAPATRSLGGPVAIMQGEPPKHGLLGVEFRDAKAVPLTIESVLKGSGAAEAGLQPGDVIVSAGSVENPDLTALQRILKARSAGDEVLLKVGRGAETLEVRARFISFTEVVLLREPQPDWKMTLPDDRTA